MRTRLLLLLWLCMLCSLLLHDAIIACNTMHINIYPKHTHTYSRISDSKSMTEVGVIFKIFDGNLPPYLLLMYSYYFTCLCILLPLFSSPLNFISAWVCEIVEYENYIFWRLLKSSIQLNSFFVLQNFLKGQACINYWNYRSRWLLLSRATSLQGLRSAWYH